MHLQLSSELYLTFICMLAVWNLRTHSPVDEKMRFRDFPGGAVVENPPANAGDMGSIPGPGRSHMPRSN